MWVKSQTEHAAHPHKIKLRVLAFGQCNDDQSVCDKDRKGYPIAQSCHS